MKSRKLRGPLAVGKPRVLGMIQRDGEVVSQMMPNVQQATIQPTITNTVEPGTRIYTYEYDMYTRLSEWGYQHKSVNHGAGFPEVYVNTIEGFWSLLRSWLRPHRGISQEKLPCYLSFFEFIHNIRRRGKSLLHSLLATLVVP